ncbi:MAG: copper chaperone PCu(A)C [Gammaproteobacteria bacterium]|nr:copper chaperone PCu(A)C [Gammaproteobacteria bacterium]
MKSIILRIFSILTLSLFAFSSQASEIQVNDPWLRAAPPSAPALAAFMQLKNTSDKAIALIALKGDASLGKLELHRTTMENGMMKMTPQESIPVAAHSSTILKPGSWHIMLIKPDSVPKKGEQIQLTLVFDNGNEQLITLPVERRKTKMH